MKDLVIFDIDGTIIKGQTQMLFLSYLLESKRIGYIFFLKLLLWFVLYRIGFVKNPKQPMEYAYSFLSGISVNEIAIWSRDFLKTKLICEIFIDAIEIINDHKKKGNDVILVSNSVEPIVKEIADYLGVQYISTILVVEDGYYTGKMRTMMYGDEKMNTVRAFMKSHQYKDSWAYCDHVSDMQLLSSVKYPVVVNASNSLTVVARGRHWPVLKFKNTIK